MAARDPVACPTKGHIFCRECIMENLLAQRADISVKNEEIAAKHAEMLRAKQIREEEESRQDIKQFELLQSVIKPNPSKQEVAGSKRKYEGEEDNAHTDQSSALVLAPKAHNDQLKTEPPKLEPPKLVSLCPMSDLDDPHSLSLKALLPISFDTLKDSSTQDSKTRVCPSCSKAFGTVLEAYRTILFFSDFLNII